jgi:DNA-binding protein H-NS
MSRAQPSAYYAEITAADEDLQLSLETLRKDEDAQRITTLEAAQERVKLMEEHLAHCQRLRREYLHPQPEPGPGSGCST